MKVFLVTWRSPGTQRTHPVGVLVAGGDRFIFQYLPLAAELHDFRPFVNFPHLGKVYRAADLFPFFSQRIMDRRRSDFPAYVHALGLAEHPTDLEVLARAGGQRKGDTVQVMAEPEIRSDGSFQHIFVVSGTRYIPGDAREAIAHLDQGTALDFVSDASNRVNPAAQLVSTTAGENLGWVPDTLVPLVLATRRSHHELTVVRANGVEWPSHMSLVVELRGQVASGFRPFPAHHSVRASGPVAVV